MTPVRTLQARQSHLKRSLNKQGIVVDADSPQWAEVQAVLARGDRRLAAVLLQGGALSLRGFRDTLERHGLSAAEFTGARQPGSPQPWDVVDGGIKPSFYRYELRLAGDERLGHRCPPGALHCATCGVCAPLLPGKPGSEMASSDRGASCIDINPTA
jgi:hypothetical protein